MSIVSTYNKLFICRFFSNYFASISKIFAKRNMLPKNFDPDSLIVLLEEQRCAFSDQYYPLLTAQQAALRKADDLLEESDESLKRNHTRKKASNILKDIRDCISYDVYILCALAIKVSALGSSKLTDYVPKIRIWWGQVEHPKGLTSVSEEYGRNVLRSIPNSTPAFTSQTGMQAFPLTFAELTGHGRTTICPPCT